MNKKELIKEMNRIANEVECYNCDKDFTPTDKRQSCPNCKHYQR